MTTGPKPAPIPVDWKPYHDGEQMNFTATSLRLGNPMTGSEKSGWCLYAMRGSCWNQRTKAAFPPEQGMKPELSGGAWVWAGDPKPAPATMTMLELCADLKCDKWAEPSGDSSTTMHFIARCSPPSMAKVMEALIYIHGSIGTRDREREIARKAIALLNATSERAGGLTNPSA